MISVLGEILRDISHEVDCIKHPIEVREMTQAQVDAEIAMGIYKIHNDDDDED